MKLRMKLLDLTLIGLLSAGLATPEALQAAEAEATVQSAAPVRAVGRHVVNLPGGAVAWAVEDPQPTAPRLSVAGPATAPVRDGRITGPVRFQGHANYDAFIASMEVLVYDGRDADLVSPLARIALSQGAMPSAEWDGKLEGGRRLVPGDELRYVVRATGHDGAVDETHAQLITLATPDEYARGLQALRDVASRERGTALSAEDAERLQLQAGALAGNGLRQQNIALHGSRVRLHGRGLAPMSALRVNGQPVPVDAEGNFSAEYLAPVGQQSYEIAVGQAEPQRLTVDVTGRYLFLVALADVTLSEGSAGGNIEPLAGDERYEDGFLSEGRLAFYLKGKVKGKYLVTAQADTQERELDRLFTGFLDADPRDVFRRLDPDAYYPVYGDDSVTTRDVDSQGKLYVRVDWDRSQAIWGNASTGIHGTEYGQYQRSLYGAALDYRSRASTSLGEVRTELRGFVSEAQSAPGHSEFLGTGGSLYYLRHTDLLPGSDRLVLELRDERTGRVESRVALMPGVDYEIDFLQGRVLLTRPLSQVAVDQARTLTRDGVLQGYTQVLLADYEYVPQGFDADQVGAGLRARHWLGDHVAVGATYVDENRAGEDYLLAGGDLTLQAGRGTFLKLEHTRSEATAAPVFFSDNGGLDFTQLNPVSSARAGEARAVEARANLRELGWTARDWTAGAWWRDVDAGFSISRFDQGLGIRETGAEFGGEVSEQLQLFGRATRAERGDARQDNVQLTADWRATDLDRWGFELRHVRERDALLDQQALLAALSYRRQATERLELYGIAQASLDEQGGYEDNDRLVAGARYGFGQRSSVGLELGTGSRGESAQLNAEYGLADDHTLYGAYTWSSDTTASRVASEFDRRLTNGWTVGQRWRASNRVNVFNESQSLRSPDGSTGTSHTVGMDLFPGVGWQLGATVTDAELSTVAGPVDRRAYSVSGGRSDAATQWSSKLEYRQDQGAEQREQWVTTHRVMHRLNEDWRVAGRLNWADTDDRLNAAADARLVEGNLGVAWRPHDRTDRALFAKYTYLYDRASLGQDGGAQYDQRSQVLAVEGVFELGGPWSIAPKLASRWGDYRLGRGAGPWLDSRADFMALQVRYHLPGDWDALAEVRQLDVRDGGTRRGALVGIDRQVGEHFKVGVGYNFADFSDDLTDLEYDHKGFFLNLAGFY